jgi:hypothetical protein
MINPMIFSRTAPVPCDAIGHVAGDGWAACDVLAVVRAGDCGAIDRMLGPPPPQRHSDAGHPGPPPPPPPPPAGDGRRFVDVNAAIPEMVLGRETITTALIEAVRAGQTGVVEQLLARGAAPELASSDGTVSHSCACIGSPCLRRCVHGASIDLADGRRGRGQHGARAQAARGAAQPFRGRR